MIIGILGAPSSGKSTLAYELSKQYEKSIYCYEYAREFIEKYQRHPKNLLDQYYILQKCIELEKQKEMENGNVCMHIEWHTY